MIFPVRGQAMVKNCSFIENTGIQIYIKQNRLEHLPFELNVVDTLFHRNVGDPSGGIQIKKFDINRLPKELPKNLLQHKRVWKIVLERVTFSQNNSTFGTFTIRIQSICNRVFIGVNRDICTKVYKIHVRIMDSTFA